MSNVSLCHVGVSVDETEHRLSHFLCALGTMPNWAEISSSTHPSRSARPALTCCVQCPECHLWPPELTVRPCLTVAVVFSLPHAACAQQQQQSQHRERLETFDDIIRNSLEVTRGYMCVFVGGAHGKKCICELQLWSVYVFRSPPFFCVCVCVCIRVDFCLVKRIEHSAGSPHVPHWPE